MTEPVLIESDVHDGIESPEWPMPGLTSDDLLYWRQAIHVHVEIENLFPHGGEKNQVALLTGVFLRDLEFQSLVRVWHGAQERRRRLTHLEIDWSILDLNDNVFVQLSVKRMK